MAKEPAALSGGYPSIAGSLRGHGDSWSNKLMAKVLGVQSTTNATGSPPSWQGQANALMNAYPATQAMAVDVSRGPGPYKMAENIDTKDMVFRLLGDPSHIDVRVTTEKWGNGKAFALVSIYDVMKDEVVLDIREDLNEFPSISFFQKIEMLRQVK